MRNKLFSAAFAAGLIFTSLSCSADAFILESPLVVRQESGASPSAHKAGLPPYAEVARAIANSAQQYILFIENIVAMVQDGGTSRHELGHGDMRTAMVDAAMAAALGARGQSLRHSGKQVRNSI